MIFESRKSMFFSCPFLEGKCLGKRCAAWRWFDKPCPDPDTIDHEDPLAKFEPDVRPDGVPKDYEFWPADEDQDAYWCEQEESAIARRRGYCGVSGKPEIWEYDYS